MKGKNKYNILLLLLILLIIAVIMIGCDSEQPAGAPKKSNKLKSETKWVIDNVSEVKLYKEYYNEYNEEGKLIKSEEYQNYGKLFTHTDFYYADNSRQEIISYYNMSGSLDSTIQNTYIHNGDGRIIKRISSDLNGTTLKVQTFDYDPKGNISRKVEYSPTGIVVSETNYAYLYNQEGNIVERVINPGTNGTFESKDSIVYRLDIMNVEKVSINSAGSIELIHVYTYNNEGKIVKEILKGNDGTIIRKYLIEYTYF